MADKTARKNAIKLMQKEPVVAAGPMFAGRYSRQLALLEQKGGGNAERIVSYLNAAAQWASVAVERAPASADVIFEQCITLYRLGTFVPAHAADAAVKIIAGFGPLEPEGELPPIAAEALAWARSAGHDGRG
jgi:hypothetical protein